MKKTTYKITEIFESIQGEGSHTGRSVIFVRFGLCNLKCEFCDTDFSTYKLMTGWDIFEAVRKFKSTRIVFTGGEPALQLDQDLIDLLAHHYELHIETNGTIPLEVKGLRHIVVSPKSGQKFLQRSGNDIKLLVDHKDEFPLDLIEETTNFENYYLQPIDGFDYPANLASAIQLVKDNPKWRLSIQVHKLINIQ